MRPARSKSRRRIRIGSAALAGLGVAAIVASGDRDRAPRVVWNVSASAPAGPYWVEPAHALQVGDWVAVSPPEPLAAWLVQRGYLAAGAPLLKQVAALPPVVLCRRGAAVTLAGRPAARAAARDRAGRALPDWQGCRRLTAGEIVLLNPASDSLDSRYFGPVPRRAIVGRARPLWRGEAGGRGL